MRILKDVDSISGKRGGTDASGEAVYNPADTAVMQEEIHTVQADAGNLLMLSVQQGDRGALRQLYRIYNGRLYSFILRIVGDSASAEDIVQETWMSLYENRERYQSTYKFSTWLFTIARRKALSELRRRKVRAIVRPLKGVQNGTEQDEIAIPQETFVSPERATDGRLMAAMVEQALALLPPGQREIVMLRDIEGFENEEIAEILEWDIKPGAIRKRVFDAREAFRRAMIGVGYREHA